MKGNGYRKDRTRPGVSFEELLVHCDACSAAFITRVPISRDQEWTRAVEPEPVGVTPSSVLAPSG